MTPGKIRFIDKDAATCRFVTDLLRQQGHAVELAASGMAGPKASARDRLDLILVGPVLDDLPADPSRDPASE